MTLPEGMSSCAVCVEITDDGGTTWDDVSDDVTVITPGEGTRQTGEAFVFGEDLALVVFGKRDPLDWVLRGVYTEGTATTDVWNTLYTSWSTTCGGTLGVRYAPLGCATTSQVFALPPATAKVTSITPPLVDAGSPDVLMYEATVHANTFTWATYA